VVSWHQGRRNERSEEEGGYGGYGRTEAVPDYHHQSQQGGYGVVAQPPRQISKNIPVDLLTQILSQRTGQNVQVGNIRTTIFDMFGDQASPSVKMFVNLALSQLQVSIDITMLLLPSPSCFETFSVLLPFCASDWMCRQEKMVCLKWISEMVEDMRVEQKTFEGIFYTLRIM
jgi:hypothetical protein